jgi:hypothetical protein
MRQHAWQRSTAFYEEAGARKAYTRGSFPALSSQRRTVYVPMGVRARASRLSERYYHGDHREEYTAAGHSVCQRRAECL